MPPWVVEALMAAIKGPKREAAHAAASCRAILAEWLNVEQLYVWLDAGDYARIALVEAVDEVVGVDLPAAGGVVDVGRVDLRDTVDVDRGRELRRSRGVGDDVGHLLHRGVREREGRVVGRAQEIAPELLGEADGVVDHDVLGALVERERERLHRDGVRVGREADAPVLRLMMKSHSCALRVRPSG